MYFIFVFLEKKMPDLYDVEKYCKWTEEKDTWSDHPKLDQLLVGCRECLMRNHGKGEDSHGRTFEANNWQSILTQSKLTAAPIKSKLNQTNKGSHNQIKLYLR